MVFPRVTGIRLLNTNWDVEMSAPSIMPQGIMNMFATQCSSPIVTKAEIGNQTPIALPPKVLAALACQTAMHTSQLHSMPLATACKPCKLYGRRSQADILTGHADPELAVHLSMINMVCVLVLQHEAGALTFPMVCHTADNVVKEKRNLIKTAAYNTHRHAKGLI